MDVIIISKTKMSNAICVSGLLENGRPVRLLTRNGHNQDADTKINIGHIYSITFSERHDKRPPHIEDILVNTLEYKSCFSSLKEMVDYLFDNMDIKLWSGGIDRIFDGKLQWTGGGSGYISASGGIPENSVGFWMPNKDLKRNYYNQKVRYSYPIEGKNISFVGLQPPIDVIPAGTLVRVSLARWWSPDESEERCYLQLSGWLNLT